MNKKSIFISTLYQQKLSFFLLVQSEKSAHLQQEQSEDKQQNLVYCSCKLGNRWLI